MRKPSVNIGPRQNGRLKAESILDCGEERDMIERTIRRALSAEFRVIAHHTDSLYGDGEVSLAIIATLKRWKIPATLSKAFHYVPV